MPRRRVTFDRSSLVQGTASPLGRAETGAYCQARKPLRAGFEDGFDVLGRPAAVEHILFELSVRESIGQLKWRRKRGIMRFVGLLVMDSSRQYQAFGARASARLSFFLGHAGPIGR